MRGGDFRFDIGTAGSVSLVLQTIAVPLSFAAASRISIRGGTHVPWSPCFHYLALHWRHFMQRIGYEIALQQDYAGFYPRGGGLIHSTIRPAHTVTPLDLATRGSLRRIRGISAVARLDVGIAERQKAQVLRRLAARHPDIEIATELMPAQSPGTVIALVAEFEHGQCCFCALGKRGKPAEQVADEAVAQLERFLAADGAIDAYLADQLLLPLACVAGTSRLRTAEVTSHLLTNAGIIREFLPVQITVDGSPGRPGTVEICGIDPRTLTAPQADGDP
jgi:RNA 3'-terminal phosphate cyclase (ATP)